MAHHPPPQWDAGAGLLVARFRHGPLWNFSYLVACEATGEAAVIDPAWDAVGILEAAAGRGLRVTTVLLTHGHSDHVNGVTEILAAGARAFVHAGDEPGVRAHTSDATTFAEAESFGLGRLSIAVHHTPGHTPGSVSYVVAGRLFTGDTLAIGSPGTPGPEAGSLEALWQSTLSLRGLAPETRLHPGHDSGPEPTATIETERLRNAGLRAASLEEFRAAVERATGRSHQ